MKYLAAAVIAALLALPGPAAAYQCNDRHYTNSDGDVVHSPSCGPEHDHARSTADCRDGSVSYSETL